MMNESENNLMENVPDEEYRQFRKVAVGSILATDMKVPLELRDPTILSVLSNSP